MTTYLICLDLTWDFPGGSDGKVSACNAGDSGSIPGLGRSPGEGNGNPLQYSCLENSMDGGAWWAIVHGVTKSRTQLSNFTETSHCSNSPCVPRTSMVTQMVKCLPAMQETQVQSLGWEDPWRRERLPTPVFWPGELHGQRSLVGYSP